MDLNTVTALARPRNRAELPPPEAGDAFVAGGTWLFSEPQRHLSRLVDLSGLDWIPLQADDTGLTLAATCTVATLDGFEAPAAWRAAPLIGQCCRAFLASFKIWNMATVGGNICMSLPAGPMTSLTAALEGTCHIWTADGGARQVPVVEFVRGPLDNALQPGEVLRAITLPARTLRRRAAFRRASLFPLGRSGVLLIGTHDTAAPEGAEAFTLTITASTVRPVQFTFPALPPAAELAACVAALPDTLYYDDAHGRPDWRRHMTQMLAAEIHTELAEGRP